MGSKQETVTVKVKMENKTVNAVLDSGAGCSIIDVGSLETIGLKDNINVCSSCLINASGDKMNIVGVVNICPDQRGGGARGVSPLYMNLKY